MQKFVLFCERYGVALAPICLILAACGLWPEMELLVPSLPDMKQVFGVSDGQIQQLLTVNFVGFLIGVLIAGPLCDSVGRKTVLVGGALAYLISSFLSAMAPGFGFLMVSRFLQGFTMTGPLVAGVVLILESTSGIKQVFWMSLSNSAITLCMAAGPIVGSWINTGFGYQGNLWSILILGLVGLMPSFFFVSESLQKNKKRPFKVLQIFKGYFSLLRDWRFMCLAIPMCAISAAYFIYVGVSALFMVDTLGIPASSFGRYQGPIIGCFSIVSLSSSCLLQRFGLIRCITVGTAFSSLGCLLLLCMSLFFKENAICTTVFMMLFASGMVPVCSLLFPYCVGHLPSELQGSAQAMIQALRLFFTSLGTFILGFVYEGSLLPVTVMMSITLVIGIFLLWKGREFMRGELSTGTVMGAH